MNGTGRNRKTNFSNTFNRTGDGEDALMNALNNFADASLDARLLAQIGDIFAGLANYDACIFCADQGTKGEGVMGHGRRGTRLGWGCCGTRVSKTASRTAGSKGQTGIARGGGVGHEEREEGG